MIIMLQDCDWRLERSCHRCRSVFDPTKPNATMYGLRFDPVTRDTQLTRTLAEQVQQLGTIILAGLSTQILETLNWVWLQEHQYTCCILC